MAIKKCAICGKEFYTSAGKKFCSIACRSMSPDIQKHVGEKWNELIIKAAEWDGKRIIVTCKCSCGKVFKTRYDNVTSGKTLSCGHLTQYKEKDLTGQRRGKLVAIKRLRDGKKSAIWQVRCDCGNVREMTAENFVKSKSCGCDQDKNRVKNMLKAHEAYYKDGTNINAARLNKKASVRNAHSDHVGVVWKKERQKWQAQIEFKKQRYYLGRYDDINDAIEARKAAEKALFGEYQEEFAEKYPAIWERIKDKFKQQS